MPLAVPPKPNIEPSALPILVKSGAPAIFPESASEKIPAGPVYWNGLLITFDAVARPCSPRFAMSRCTRCCASNVLCAVPVKFCVIVG